VGPLEDDSDPHPAGNSNTALRNLWMSRTWLKLYGDIKTAAEDLHTRAEKVREPTKRLEHHRKDTAACVSVEQASKLESPLSACTFGPSV
jgi:hypothetical protein